jgi:hypothetical protein
VTWLWFSADMDLPSPAHRQSTRAIRRREQKVNEPTARKDEKLNASSRGALTSWIKDSIVGPSYWEQVAPESLAQPAASSQSGLRFGLHPFDQGS